MLITLIDGVQWNTESSQQSEEAMQWLREEVMPRMGTQIGEFDKTEPSFDAYMRPINWEVRMPTCIVTITREYVRPNSSSWAMKKDSIVVTPKTE